MLTAISLVVSGLLFVIVPYFDRADFAELVHIPGRIESVQRITRPGSPNSAVYVTLSSASGRRRIRVDSYDWYPASLARLSLGRAVNVWVDGEFRAWQVESDGEVLVGYRDRLESSRQQQHGLSSIGWPLLGSGVLVGLLGRRRLR